MNHIAQISLQAINHGELKRRLLEAEPDIDELTLSDTLEGATSLNETIIEIVRSSADDAAMAAALRERIESMKERLARIEARSERKRELVKAAMEAAGLEKVLAPDLTISLRKAPPALNIVDEQLLPEWFWIPQPAKLDRRGLLEAVKSGAAIPGAELAGERLMLSVRTR